jgi:pimeloyl-ACP methyl ester carboxylesterase
MWFRASGDGGPPLLLLHGAGSCSRTWLRQLPAIGRVAHAIAVDLPGHGRSDGGPPPRTLSEYRESVRGLVTALGLSRPIVAGHSMGGAIALDYALAYPGELSGLVLCAAGARMPVHSQIFDLLERGFAAFQRFFAKTAFGPGVALPDAEAATRDLLTAPATVLLSDLRACDAFDVRTALANLRLPILLLCGTSDRITPPNISHELAAALGGAREVMLEGAGHMLPWEEPERVGQEIASFVGECRSVP